MLYAYIKIYEKWLKTMVGAPLKNLLLCRDATLRKIHNAFGAANSRLSGNSLASQREL